MAAVADAGVVEVEEDSWGTGSMTLVSTPGMAGRAFEKRDLPSVLGTWREPGCCSMVGCFGDAVTPLCRARWALQCEGRTTKHGANHAPTGS